MSSIPTHPLKLLHRLPLAAACALMGMASAQAQTTPPPLAGHDADTQVLPVWNASSGRVEAFLLLSPDQNELNPLDRVFPRDAAMPSLGLGATLDNGSRLQGNLQPEANAGLALLCSQGIHVALTLGPLGQQCLLAEMGSQNDLLLPSSRTPGVTLDAQWHSADGALDLNFGLSWLDTSLQGAVASSPLGFDMRPPLASTLPSLPVMQGQFRLGDISLRELHWSGNLALGAQKWLSLGGSVGTQELSTLAGAPLRWDSATVTLGVGFRGLSGRLTGRLIELPHGQNFTGLDLGVSWRTPWQGELIFGAQNLLNKTPDTSQWPLSDLPAIEVPGGRTPYVRYKQDL